MRRSDRMISRAAGIGRLPADEPGIAALRRHGNATLRRRARRTRAVSCVEAGPNQCERPAPIEPARLDKMAGDQIGIGDDMRGADDFARERARNACGLKRRSSQ